LNFEFELVLNQLYLLLGFESTGLMFFLLLGDSTLFILEFLDFSCQFVNLIGLFLDLRLPLLNFGR
jgi:hypothetical protein